MACHVPTPEEQGEALASEYVKKQLYHPDSYEPIECMVDTAYSPVETPATFEKLTRFADLYKNLQKLESSVKSKRDSYEMYKSHYNDLRKYGLSDSYAEYQYKSAKEELEKEQTKYDETLEKVQKLAEEIQVLNEQPRTPCGWKVVHTYRAKTNGGMVISSGIYILTDNEFQNVILSLDEDQLNDIMTISQELNAE